MEEARLILAPEPGLGLPHVGEPRVYRTCLALLVQSVGRELREDPLAVLHVPAADHEDDGLPAAFGERGEVVFQVGDVLEVHEEFESRLRAPFALRSADVSGADDRAVVAVHVEDRLQDRLRSRSRDAKRLGSGPRVQPGGDAVARRPVASLRTDLPELCEVLQPLRDVP